MKIKRIFWVFYLVFIKSILMSQVDRVELYQHDGKFQILHIIEPGQTLYRISKMYHIGLDEMRINDEIPNPNILKIGDSLMLFFNRSKFYIIPKNGTVPVYYTVKPGDNLFRISRIILGVHEELIMSLNDRKDSDIKSGEVLHLGYYDINAAATVSVPVSTPNPTYLETSTMDKIIHSEAKSEGKWVTKSGQVMWFEDTDLTDEKYALHISAKPGSEMFIMNPITNRKIKVKVIGNITPNTYPKEIQALLSPGAARALGALDTRFYAKMKYEEPVEN